MPKTAFVPIFYIWLGADADMLCRGGSSRSGAPIYDPRLHKSGTSGRWGTLTPKGKFPCSNGVIPCYSFENSLFRWVGNSAVSY